MTDTVEKTILPEVRRYLDAWDAELSRLDKLRDELYNLFYERGLSEEKMTTYLKARNAYYEAYEKKGEVHDGLAEKLRAETENKVVKFIAGKWLDVYPDESIEVLKILPATVDEMCALARENDWCSSWDVALNAAIAAGVIDQTPAWNVKRELRELLIDSMYTRDANRALELVDQLVELSVTEALKTQDVVTE